MALSSCFSAVWVMACGPDFPAQMLDDRNQLLKGMPSNSFAWEVTHLIKADDALQANDIALNAFKYSDDQSDFVIEYRKKMNALEAQGLTQAQAEVLQKMRQAGSGDEAYKLGESLPEAVRLYTAAAVQYGKQEPNCFSKKAKNRDALVQQKQCETDNALVQQRMGERFQAVLDLPGEQGKLRTVWAAYMLGKIHASRANGAHERGDAGRDEEFASARKYFALSRERAKAGDYDPEGLGVASYGEEARMYLALPGLGSCDPTDLVETPMPPRTPKMSEEEFNRIYRAARSKPLECYKDISADHYKKAIGLYAQQGARGDGVTSLKLLADYAFRQPDLLQKLVDDPLVLKMLVAYAQNHVGDKGRINRGPYPGYPGGKDRITDCDSDWEMCDAALGLADVRPAPVLLALLEAVEKQKLEHVEGADRLAALAYREARYDLAERLLKMTDTPLAYWVRAKLALQHGDMQAAAQAYAQASKNFPALDQQNLSEPRINRLRSEEGALALARGEYVQAFGFFVGVAQTKEKQGGDLYSNPYLYDANYIAERVLTTPELKNYIDAHVPPSGKEMMGPQVDWIQPYAPVADTLRYLLARRLMREKRYDEAIAYFPQPGSLYFKDVQVREHAQQFVQALKDAEHAWTYVGKAQALMNAASIARYHGMEIMGYEQFPDYRFSNGNYTCCAGHTDEEILDTPNAYISQGERERFSAAQVEPASKYHYRQMAADLASAAADQLPPHSQAFAASLCQAFAWTRGQDYGKAQTYYQRYVEQGAQISWKFGYSCPEPDYSGASRRQHLDSWNQAVYEIKQIVPLRIRYIALLLALFIGTIIWLCKRKR